MLVVVVVVVVVLVVSTRSVEVVVVSFSFVPSLPIKVDFFDQKQERKLAIL